MNNMQQVAKYDVFEVTLTGKTEGNPFVDYTITGQLQNNEHVKG